MNHNLEYHHVRHSDYWNWDGLPDVQAQEAVEAIKMWAEMSHQASPFTCFVEDMVYEDGWKFTLSLERKNADLSNVTPGASLAQKLWSGQLRGSTSDTGSAAATNGTIRVLLEDRITEMLKQASTRCTVHFKNGAVCPTIQALGPLSDGSPVLTRRTNSMPMPMMRSRRHRTTESATDGGPGASVSATRAKYSFYPQAFR